MVFTVWLSSYCTIRNAAQQYWADWSCGAQVDLLNFNSTWHMEMNIKCIQQTQFRAVFLHGGLFFQRHIFVQGICVSIIKMIHLYWCYQYYSVTCS